MKNIGNTLKLTRPKGLLDPKVEDDLAFFRSRDSLDLINKGASVDVY